MLERDGERFRLLKRFLREDADIFRIGDELGLECVSKYREEYRRHQVAGSYFYIPYDEKDAVISEIARSISDQKLVEVFSRFKPRDFLGIGFKGRYYIYEEGKGLKIGSAWDDVKKNVLEALDQLGERGYAFLRAIVELHEEGKWNGDYYGASYVEILRKMRQICGKPLMPAPRDFPILASYEIYYKSGSRKHPSHSIPEERIDAVREALGQWRGA